MLDQVADEKSLIIAVGYMLRSSPAVVAAKQLMKEVGDLPTLDCSLWSLGTHDLIVTTGVHLVHDVRSNPVLPQGYSLS